jgi:hypothetical protein
MFFICVKNANESLKLTEKTNIKKTTRRRKMANRVSRVLGQ